MKNLFLVEPNKKYQKSFENYAMAYRKINDEHYFNKYKKALESFQDYLKDLYNYSHRNDLPQGEVITSTFWLIDKIEVVGVVRIRHQEVDYAGHIGYDISPNYRNRGYGFQILKLALGEAIKIGVEEVILICNIDNTASKKIIEKNNGKLLGSILDEEENEYLYKYNITLNTQILTESVVDLSEKKYLNEDVLELLRSESIQIVLLDNKERYGECAPYRKIKELKEFIHIAGNTELH